MSNYYVDERVGCVAVRKASSTVCNGLNKDMKSVILYWAGEKDPDEPWFPWYVPTSYVYKAKRLCKLFNELDKLQKTITKGEK
jgi:hypothetical protein